MKFTEKESIGIARLRTGRKKLSQQTLHAIHEQIDGWASGLVLMLEQYSGLPISKDINNPAAQESVFNYFAGKIFQRAEKEVQEFLLKTAFLQKTTEAMASELTGLSKAGNILFELNRKNYFIIEVTGPFAASTFIRAHGSLAGRRLYAAVGAATGTVDNQGGYDTYFRFHGATMNVMLNVGNIASTQVLGSGSSGQIQSLYDAVRLGTGGLITSMSVQMSTASDAATVPNVKIYMGHTTKTVLAITDSYAINMENATLVYSGSLNVQAGLQQGD